MFLLFACSPEAAPPEPHPAPAPAPVPTPVPAPVPVPTTPPVPLLSEVLGDCGGTFRTPATYPNQLLYGDDLHRVVLADPAAICNDGTPGVLYIRAATDPAHLDDAIVHLQGGSDCASYEDCAARWCGNGTYDASKMSSTWAPESTDGIGMFAQTPANGFAGWAHVWVYYCSSDNWSGVSSALPPPPDGEPAWRMERHGHDIVAAALAALSAGMTSDDGAVTLPPLAPGATVLFTGTSAGSNGAQTNLDFARDTLSSSLVLGLFDTGMGPEPGTLEPASAALYLEAAEARFTERLTAEALPPFGDASCLASASAADAWQCSATSHLPYQWIDTPFFFRMDLRDPLLAAIYVPFGIDSQEFAQAIGDSLALLAADRGASVFGPACGEHLGVEAAAPFLLPRLDTASGPLSLHDAIGDWLAGTPVVEIDAGLDRSLCP
jgi:hypothetical protein